VTAIDPPVGVAGTAGGATGEALQRSATVPGPRPLARSLLAGLRSLARDSIASRIFLAVFGGLVLTQVAGFLLMTGERLRVLPLTDTKVAVAVIAGAAEAVLRVPPPARAAVAASLKIEGGNAALVDTFDPRGETFDPPPVRQFRVQLRQRLGASSDFITVVMPPPSDLDEAAVPPPPGLPFGMRPTALHVWLHLADRADEHRWLVVQIPPDLLGQLDRIRIILWWGLSLIASIPLSLLVARRLTAPIRRFSMAAERFGLDIEASPLPATGPGELKAATEAINRMQARLKRFVDDRTEMLAAISHDLRTPISRLRLRVESLPPSGDKARLVADLHLMEQMLAATLEFSRDASKGEGQCRIDLASLAETLCAELSDLGEDVAYRGPAYLEFTCRPIALGRAVRNLLENACEYAGDATLHLSDCGDRVEILVADNGPGIADAELERVLEPFYRLDAARSTDHEGTGLGLSIARNIARAHGGDVVLRNRTEGGLAVTLWLPRPRIAGA
jgi:signal transduction histidine kinase